jgi:hypothetical protein
MCATHGLGCDDMLLLLSMEACDALDDHVVGLGCPRCEDNIFRVSPNEVSDILKKAPLSISLEHN